MTIRQYLRSATRASHDRLDASIEVSAFGDRAVYGRFLAEQYRARVPIERWALQHCPSDITPPPTAGLLRSDLADLGMSPPASDLPFTLPAGAEPIGLAWAIAGSHLGNRAILAHLPDAEAMPTRFLESSEMTSFWRTLRPRLDQVYPQAFMKQAALAADAVFTTFIEALDPAPRSLAA